MNVKNMLWVITLSVVANGLSAILLSFNQESNKIALITVVIASLMGVLLGYLLFRIHVLRSLGIRNWEKTLSQGTTTKKCIAKSHTSLNFLGIASTKWLKEEREFRKMLIRHANTGGRARFLLMQPYGEACIEFEKIKNVPEGSISQSIIKNIDALLDYKSEGYNVEVKLYDRKPHFRLTMVDTNFATVGIYSYSTHSGQNSPQIILGQAPQEWSFYFAFSSYYERLWEDAKNAKTHIARLRRQSKK
ncbi:DUF5919 domain-containing protein [Hellea sp.]|nr:DUF5919 domain-containing protein [Hellea sp.]